MSGRVKRPHRSDGCSGEPSSVSASKRRKCARPSGDDEQSQQQQQHQQQHHQQQQPSTTSASASESAGAGQWQARPINDLKISSIYNRSAVEPPAELFRKDLISAMKLPDSEPLAADEYWLITDQWKQEWERGVQVPVNPDSLPEPVVTVNQRSTQQPPPNHNEFKLPKNKYIRITQDEQFNPEQHQLSLVTARAEAACAYDLDETDMAWLRVVNGERALSGLNPLTPEQLERALERLELHCWDRVQAIVRSEEGLGIEFDENVICDVCRSPDSEEGNEMVFCDSCNICVHQACYGITKIPPGQWLCRTCALSQRPDCLLCPNKGGAMKCTRSGSKWAHVSCALWIPEVSIGCVEKMEPITKISSIPQSRWALICVLCRERVGACIQCSVKTCKTAYHVTCAFKHGLEMRAIIEDENAEDGVKLRSYCQKHSVSSKKEKSACSGSDDDDCKRKKRKDMTSEEKNQARAARLHEIEAEFDKHVSPKDVGGTIGIDAEAVQYIYNYWKLKRRAAHNKPLLPPKFEDVDMLSHKQEQADTEKMNTFVKLRQDLERVRNLCYMVSRREKLSRSYFRMREQTFHKQVAVLSDTSSAIPTSVESAVIEANHGSSIYDRLYSHQQAQDHTNDFESILARIAGKSPYESSDEKINGLLKDSKDNPYKKLYLNGASKRRSGSMYGSSYTSASESEQINKINKRSTNSEDTKKASTITKGRNSVKKRRRGRPSLRPRVDSSSEDDIKGNDKLQARTLKRMVREIGDGISASDSDELMIKTTEVKAKHNYDDIYSDTDSSESSGKDDRNEDRSASDSQQQPFRTKAAVKEFSQQSKPNAKKNKAAASTTPTPIDDKERDKENIKVTKKKPSDLIVPQRQAAKKASENMRSTTVTRVKDQTPAVDSEPTKTLSTTPVEEKPKVEKTAVKVKTKGKETKEISTLKQHQDKKENKVSSSTDIFNIDKELDKDDMQEMLPYVPQRQAAKKAAEHIKSGLGKPGTIPVSESTEIEANKNKKEMEITPIKAKKEMEITKTKVEPPTTKPETKKPVTKVPPTTVVSSSSSSSSCSSTDSSTSSSSDSDSDSSHKSDVSPPANKSNTAKDWPFLDKGSKSAAVLASSSSSSSSSSEESDDEKQKKSVKKPADTKPKKPDIEQLPAKKSAPIRRDESPTKLVSGKKSESAVEKKLKTPDEKPEVELQSSAVEREESRRGSTQKTKPPVTRGKSKRLSHSSDRPGDAVSRARDTSGSEPGRGPVEKQKEQLQQSKSETRKRKPSTLEKAPTVPNELDKPRVAEKASVKSSQLSSTVRKTDKKLNDKTDLEKEIMERKAEKDVTERKGRDSSKTKSTFDKLFEKREKQSKTEAVVEPKREERVSRSSTKKKAEEIAKAESEKSLVEITEKEIISLVEMKETLKTKKVEDEEVIKPIETLAEPMQVESELPENFNKDIYFGKDDNKMEIENDIKEEITIIGSSNKVNIDEKLLTPEKIHEVVPQSISNEPEIIPYPHRSIFSPQPSIRDASTNEIFDFDNEIMSVTEDKAKDEPISGQYGVYRSNDSLFKEDSKEDSARETLYLVEKLRMELSRKSGNNQPEDMELEPKPEDEEQKMIDEKPLEEISAIPISADADISMSTVVEDAACLAQSQMTSQTSLSDLPEFITDNTSGYSSAAYHSHDTMKNAMEIDNQPVSETVENTNNTMQNAVPNRWMPETTNFQPQDMEIEPQPLLPENQKRTKE